MLFCVYAAICMAYLEFPGRPLLLAVLVLLLLAGAVIWFRRRR